VRQVDPGVRDEDVDAAEAAGNFGHDLGDARTVGDIESHRRWSRQTGRLDLVARCLCVGRRS